jgi:hypothetical protein
MIPITDQVVVVVVAVVAVVELAEWKWIIHCETNMYAWRT